MAGVVRIRAEGKATEVRGRRARLVARVNAATSDLLADTDRVLVVYGQQGEGASLYYEPEQTPLPAAKPAPRAP